MQQICKVFIILNEPPPLKHSVLKLDGGLLGSLSACSPACQMCGITLSSLKLFSPSPLRAWPSKYLSLGVIIFFRLRHG